MRVLVLHNNNLPICLYKANKFQLTEEIFVEAKILKYDGLVQSESFDEYVCKELADLSNNVYDVIVMPYSFSIENYLEFSGLRIAAHIRLTPGWKKINTPLLFVGPETKDDICTLSNLSTILYSNRVFSTDVTSQLELIQILLTISKDYPVSEEGEVLSLESSHYNKLLDSISIQAPSNLDTRHSIANRWAVYRWEQLFSQKEGLEHNNLTDNLYIKFLIAKNKKIEFFNKKFYKKHPSLSHTISGIQDKHIVYIDDEESNGWRKLLSNIIIGSKATLSVCPFDESVKSLSKEQLLEKIKDFIRHDEKIFGIADCYIIDLRLHEADSDSNIDHTKISGHLLAEYIKTEVNRGCQIIIFTASNKSWNVQNSLVRTHVADYVVKESPEMGYSSNDTYLSMGRFMASIKKAIDRSYIKDIYDYLNRYDNKNGELNLLYEFAELLNLDNGEANPTILKSAALNLMVFIEEYIKGNFVVDELYNVFRDNVKLGCFRGKLCCKTESNNGYKTVVESAWFDQPLHPGWDEAMPKADITKIIAPLYMFYEISNDDVNKIVKLKHKRNTNIAHGGKSCDISLTELRNIYDKIICKVLQKSFNLK